MAVGARPQCGRFRFGGSLRCVGMVHLELLHLVEGDACERKAAVLLDDRQLRVRAHRCDHRADRKLRDLRLRLQVSAAIDRLQPNGRVGPRKDGSGRGRWPFPAAEAEPLRPIGACRSAGIGHEDPRVGTIARATESVRRWL